MAGAGRMPGWVGEYAIGVPPGDVGNQGGAGAACTIAATLAGFAWAQASTACRRWASSLEPVREAPVLRVEPRKGLSDDLFEARH